MMRMLGRKKAGDGSNEVASYAPVLKAMSALKRTARLKGTVFIHEGIILGADTDLTDKQNSDFVREINALVSQYRNGGRNLSRALFGFDAGAVLIFHTAPFVFCLLFFRLEDAGEVESLGEKFLQTWSKALKIKSPEDIALPLFDKKSSMVAQVEQVVPEAPATEVTPDDGVAIPGVGVYSDNQLTFEASCPVEPQDEQSGLAAMDVSKPIPTDLPLVAEEAPGRPASLDIAPGEVGKNLLDITEVEAEPDTAAKTVTLHESATKHVTLPDKLGELKLTKPRATEVKTKSPQPDADAIGTLRKPNMTALESKTPAVLSAVAVDNSKPEEETAIPESLSSPSETPEPSVTPISDQLMNPATSDPGETWNSFRQKIENLLSKVLGRAQAVRLIERELEAIGIASGAYLLAPQFRPFGQKLMQKVKDKALRTQLEIELIALIEAHQK